MSTKQKEVEEFVNIIDLQEKNGQFIATLRLPTYFNELAKQISVTAKGTQKILKKLDNFLLLMTMIRFQLMKQ